MDRGAFDSPKNLQRSLPGGSQLRNMRGQACPEVFGETFDGAGCGIPRPGSNLVLLRAARAKSLSRILIAQAREFVAPWTHRNTLFRKLS